jgi:hypothetical protein
MKLRAPNMPLSVDGERPALSNGLIDNPIMIRDALLWLGNRHCSKRRARGAAASKACV